MRTFIFIVLSAIFYLSFFARGLYFEKDLYGVQILIYITFIVLSLRLIIKKEKTSAIYFSFIFVIPLMYLLSITYAEFPLGSIHQAFKWLTYSMFFILLFWSTYSNEKLKKWLPYIFQLTGLSISIHMYLNVLGIIESPSAFIFNRFSSVLQYPNTFAMVIGVFFLYSLVLLTKEKLNTRDIIIYSAPLTIYVYMLFGTLSRGMFIVLPLVLIIALALRNISNQALMLVIFVSASLYTVLDFLIPMNTVLKIIALLSFSTLTVIVTFYTKKFTSKSNLLQKNKLIYSFILPIIMLVSGILLILDLLFKGAVYRILPTTAQELVDRLNESSTLRERFLFIQDSFELSKQSPVIGFGGEGFTVLYYNVQQLPYRSKRIHNEFMEILVDLGWLGIILFIAVFSLLFVFLYKNMKSSSEKTIHIAVFLSLLQILLHSLLDFNMHYAISWFIVFWLLTISFSQDKFWTEIKVIQFFEQHFKLKKITFHVMSLIAFIAIFINFNFISAEQSFAHFKQTGAIESIENSVRKNPFKRQYLFEYGKVLHSINDNEIDNVIQKLIKLEPNNSITLEMVAYLFELQKKYDEALEYYEEALSLDRYNTNLYVKVSSLQLETGTQENIEKVPRLFEQFETIYKEFQKNPIGEAHNSREFNLSDDIIINVAKAYFMLENYEILSNLLNYPIDEEDTFVELISLIELSKPNKETKELINSLIEENDLERKEIKVKKNKLKNQLQKQN